MKKINTFLSGLSFSILALVMSTGVARAVDFDANSVPALVPADGNSGVRAFLGNMVDVVLIIVSIIAVLYLIYGGIQYIMAGGDADRASKGRVTITNAIIGIIIILAAFLIYNAASNAGSGQLS